jgi:transcriptional regulator with XRE-family HTH domain
VTPAEVGLPGGNGQRRTPGFRREEVASLAGVSIDYYRRLERGTEASPSQAVVSALGRALRLDADEFAHLRQLAAPTAVKPEWPSRTVRSTVLQLLETLRPNPAFVSGRTSDILAANPAGLRILPGIQDWPELRRNTARYAFLHPAARELWPDWEEVAGESIAHLRAVAGAEPNAPDLAELIAELTDQSPDFARMWARYDVHTRGGGHKTLHHPEVGEMTLSYELLTLGRTNGQRLAVYQAIPGTPDHDAMVRLDTP